VPDDTVVPRCIRTGCSIHGKEWNAHFVFNGVVGFSDTIAIYNSKFNPLAPRRIFIRTVFSTTTSGADTIYPLPIRQHTFPFARLHTIRISLLPRLILRKHRGLEHVYDFMVSFELGRDLFHLLRKHL